MFTSHLERAQHTLLVILASQRKIGVFHNDLDIRKNTFLNLPKELQTEILPVRASSELNERLYGTLQGMNKTTAIKQYGAKKVLEWRRGFDKRPPKGESLKDVSMRVIAYFQTYVYPRMTSGETVLMVGHGNTLRALIKYLENISDKDIPLIDLPFAHPLVYTQNNGTFTRTEGSYTLKRPLR